jgi:hypothetical protein
MPSLIPSYQDQLRNNGEVLNFVEALSPGTNPNFAQAVNNLQQTPRFDNPHGKHK